MQKKTGNMFEHITECDLCFVTTNGTTRKDGRLVMGAGAAKEALLLYPNLAKYFGKRVAEVGCRYHLLVHPEFSEGGWKKLAAFQTKLDWFNPTPVNLLRESLFKLDSFARANSTAVIYLNYPGIGLGGLDLATVEQLFKEVCLPDNVTVWKLK